MSNAAPMFSFDPEIPAVDEVDDAFRSRIMTAMRDLRARERRAGSSDLRLGDAANDVATSQFD